ncbi:MAG: PspA/IM30 family protein [Isosphaeraceae bacterium]|nr:PspA/IM30 family protein [Isosphaeraceae bacterium]
MFRRIVNLIRGFLGLFVSSVERRTPEALLEVEKENLRKQIGQFNQGLASHAALCERLMAQARKFETEEQELKAKVAANLRAGNRDVAAQYALRLQTASRELAENRVQLQQAEETYQNLVKSRDSAVQAAKVKIESLKHSIQDMKTQKAMGELTAMAAGMTTSIGGSGDTLDRLKSMVDEERTRAAGKVRVARDMMGTSDVLMKEAEQKALADQALADFAAREGLALPPRDVAAALPAPATDTHGKSMGPISNGGR